MATVAAIWVYNLLARHRPELSISEIDHQVISNRGRAARQTSAVVSIWGLPRRRMATSSLRNKSIACAETEATVAPIMRTTVHTARTRI